MHHIYKILTGQEWDKFQEEKTFYGSPLDITCGFIHCAKKSQYPTIKDKFFKDQSPLILLQIDVKKLSEGSLKIEANRPGGDEYPHLYSPLSLDAIASWKTLE